MKTFSAILITLLSAAPFVVMAADCKTDLVYCGKTLKNNKGWDNLGIRQACRDSKWNDGSIPAENQIDLSLFKCEGKGDGLVWVNDMKPCNSSCIDGGDGKSDYCD